jgi:hypothetical protein
MTIKEFRTYGGLSSGAASEIPPSFYHATNIRSFNICEGARNMAYLPTILLGGQQISFVRTTPSGAASCRIPKQPVGIWNVAEFATF